MGKLKKKKKQDLKKSEKNDKECYFYSNMVSTMLFWVNCLFCGTSYFCKLLKLFLDYKG